MSASLPRLPTSEQIGVWIDDEDDHLHPLTDRGTVAQGPPTMICERHEVAAFYTADFDKPLCVVCAREKRALSYKVTTA